jgi:hypothetical protein
LPANSKPANFLQHAAAAGVIARRARSAAGNLMD